MQPVVPFLDLSAMHRQVREELDAAWAGVVDSSGFVGGARVEQFEQEWASYCGADHAIGVANGTDALVVALRALGVGPGDEVVVPANTFVATAEAVVLVGATPRFVDVDPDTLLVTADVVAAALTPRTAAVVAVHLYGQPPDMDALAAVAGRAGVALIEDAAQAHGATWRGRRAGSLATVGCFSFYPGKNLGAFGDGGAVVTGDPELAGRIRCMADHGRRPGSKYDHDLVGQNSRLDALQAAVLSIKLRHLDDWNAGRQAAYARYEAGLRGSAARLVPVAPEATSVHHLAVVEVPGRDELRAALAARGVATGIHYPVPCHQQPAFEQWATGPLPVVEASAGRLLSLPMFPTLSARDVDLVVEALLDEASPVDPAVRVRRAG
ncbi:MAG TPA: DegT/DnrJ/EryC1/StrS family aminotransferase [Mycobacteriales bacterium]|nr:DegT/DnrJ/EryC1/StrS family aminotransferase [Mycobacteriales bacterium]